MTTKTPNQRQYKDVSGNPCSLDWLVKNEPEWAANQIRHRDALQSRLTELEAIVFGHPLISNGNCKCEKCKLCRAITTYKTKHGLK